MIKYKINIVILVSCVFFTIRSFYWMSDGQGSLTADGYQAEEWLVYNLTGRYFGDLEQVLLGTALICMLIEFVQQRDDSIFLIRYSGREQYLWKKMKRIVITCVIINVCKFFIGYGFLFYVLGLEQVFTMEGGRHIASGILLFTIYSIRCGVVYMILRDLLNQKIIPMVFTIAIYFVSFYIRLDNLLDPLITVKWLPFLDLLIPAGLFTGQASMFELLLGMIRQVGFTLIAVLLWAVVWKRKDVISFEK